MTKSELEVIADSAPPDVEKSKTLAGKASYYVRNYLAVNIASNCFFQQLFLGLEFAARYTVDMSPQESIDARIRTFWTGLGANCTYNLHRNYLASKFNTNDSSSEWKKTIIETVSNFPFLALMSA